MKNKIDHIRDKLQQAFAPQYLEVIDESDQHIGHAGHQGGGRHFAIHISAMSFDGMSTVEAHRLIYKALDEMIPDQIHALKIKVVR